MMKTPTYEDIQLEGEIAFRIMKNFTRMEELEYRPDSIFEADKGGWPGDFEGRTILALVLLSRTTGRKAAYLEQNLLALKENLNDRGYLKEILPEGIFNEQQLSGHNWLLRGLLEYYLWTGKEEIAEIARGIVNNLFLPVKGSYIHYPVDPKLRSYDGGAAGHIAGDVINQWYLSTDIGCAFIAMDALSQYYEIFEDPQVADLLEEMAETFMKIDFINSHMQTHASLSACRGLIRYYRCTGKEEILRFIVDFFELYQQKGMTENYANYNWFGRPLWTEPCAIVDSYLLAVELFKETREISYLATANYIFYNALGFAQRRNGGFGCDECAGTEETGGFLSIKEELYEAYWCCSMRGAEGLSAAGINSVLISDKEVYFNHYYNGEYRLPSIHMNVITSFPEEGRIQLNLMKNIGNKKFRFFVPNKVDKASVSLTMKGVPLKYSWEDGFLTADITGCGEVILTFEFILHKKSSISQYSTTENVTFWHGVLLLGVKTDTIVHIDVSSAVYRGNGVYKVGETLLEPINRSIYKEQEIMKKEKYQILF